MNLRTLRGTLKSKLQGNRVYGMLGFVVPGSLCAPGPMVPLCAPGMLGNVVFGSSHSAACRHLSTQRRKRALRASEDLKPNLRGANSRQQERMKNLPYGTSRGGPFPSTLFNPPHPRRSRYVFLLDEHDANRRVGLSIGSWAGTPRLGGRRRDQERELWGGRGRSRSGSRLCSPEVSRRGCGSVLGSGAPSARLRRASVGEPRAAAAASCQPRTSVPGRS